jgi:cytochrome c
MSAMTRLTAAVAFVLAAGAAEAADAGHGKALFVECASCHTLNASGEGVGPGLKGLFGRKAGSLEDFRYSAAMRRSAITWNAQTLDTYLADPQKEVPGNRMPYSGMPNAADRADLIAYLQTATK